MRVYPLIYSRTYKLDYISGFLLRPQDLNKELATKYVSWSLEDVKYCEGFRYSVFKVDDYIIYGGISCVLKEFVNKVIGEERAGSIFDGYLNFLYDSSGREISFFIGFAVKKDQVQDGYVPKIDLEYSLKVYLEEIKKYWDELSLETQISDSLEVESEVYNSSFEPEYNEYNDIRILTNYDEKKYNNIINYYFVQLSRNVSGNFNFLSKSLIEEINHTTLFGVTSPWGFELEQLKNNYNTNEKPQISENNYRITRKIESEPQSSASFQVKTIEDIDIDGKKKDLSFTILGILILLVIIVIIVIIILN